MKIESLKDWLAFVDEVAATAENHLRTLGIPEADWPVYGQLVLSGGAHHLEYVAGSRDRDLKRASFAVLAIRDQMQRQAKQLPKSPDQVAAQLAALSWRLHMVAAALHSEAIEGALKRRPARQAARRDGKHGIVRRVLEEAYANGARTAEAAAEWLDHHSVVELADGDVRISGRGDLWELDQNATEVCKDITLDNLKRTLSRIKKNFGDTS